MSSQTRKTNPARLLKRVATTLIIAFSALVFPSALPWMVAFWLLCFTVLASRNQPGWAPLLICLCILVVKLVPRTPALVVFITLLALVTAVRFKQRKHTTPSTLRWISASILWISWASVLLEWQSIENSGSPFAFQPERPIVCIGDSLTDGLLPDHGYPDQLKSMVNVPVVNLGFSGVSTSQGIGQLNRVLDENPQVVVIELGGHDFLKGYGRAATKKNLTKLIRECRSAGANVILMEIPRGFIFDPYASLEREIAYEQDIQLVPDTWLRQIVLRGPAAPPGMWFPNLRLSDDGIHSNQQGSQAIAKHVLHALESLYGDQITTPRTIHSQLISER